MWPGVSSDFRYRTYTSQTMPIIERYAKKGMVRKISGIPPPDEVNPPICVYSTIFVFPKYIHTGV